MSARAFALVAAIVVTLLVLAQYTVPSWAGFHTWQYATALIAALVAILAYANGARKGEDGDVGRRALLACAGAVIVGAAGLASGLLGPDTTTVARAPGQVAPLPDVGAAAFFPNADAETIRRGDAGLLLRMRDRSSSALPLGAKRVFGPTELEVQPRLAAFVEAFDEHGNHQTITQPTNPAFLSPVLTFPQRVEVARKSLPADAFATPALHRAIRAFYFSSDDAPKAGPHGTGGRSAILFSVDDDRGQPIPGGIAFATDGQTVEVGGLRLRATIGSYPSLLVSAVPYPIAVIGGFVLLVFGCWYARPRPTTARPIGGTARATLAAIAFVVLAGCAHVDAGSSNGLHPWTRPDTLRIGFYQEPDSLNPVLGSMAFASDAYQLIFDGLIQYDEKGRPVPDLATEVPSLANGGIAKDGKTLTYHLARNASWSDGVPLTSRDVIFTFRQIMNGANNTATRVGYDRVTSIDAPDAHTVRVHFAKPYPPALYLFKDLNQGAIVPEHLLGHLADLNHAPFNSKPVGSGPYILRAWEHGSRMIFDANPHYFRGAPKIPHVEITFVPDQNTLLNQMRAHDLDVYLNLPLQQYREASSIDGLALAQNSTLHWEHLAYNVKHPPLDDRIVRLALCYAIDEPSIYAKIYHGLGRLAPVHFNPDFGWGDPTLKHYPYDIAKANAMLDAAGWKRGTNGVRRRGNVALEFSLSTVAGVKNREAIEVLLQAAWRSIGADVTVKNYPAATLFAPAAAGGMLYGGKTDATIFTWQNNNPDPDDETYISPNQFPPKGQNVAFYANDRVRELEEEGLRTYDANARRPAYAEISRILYRDVPEYVFDWLPEIVAYNSDVHGVTAVPVGSDLWNISTWTIGK
jgi:peptide/nickel transport system substrate-binding protein